MRAGFRMIGRDIGGTPTCSGEARGCRMSGDWPRGGGDTGGLIFVGVGIGEVEGGTGDDLSVRSPLALGVCISRGDEGLLGIFGSAGATGTGEGTGTGGEAGVTATGCGTASTGTLHTGSGMTACLKSSSFSRGRKQSILSQVISHRSE